MSDTPRTEAALKASRNQFDALQKLTSEAAKLERENAELREKLQIEGERSIYWRENENKLRTENAALRADKERLDWLEANLYTLSASGLRCNEWPAVEIRARSGRFEAESIRAAIDAARWKEAQP